MYEKLLTTTEVSRILEMSLPELQLLRSSLNVEGKKYVCKDNSIAYLFTKDQVILLLKGLVHRLKKDQVKEQSKELLKERIKNRKIDQRNAALKVLPEWK